MASVLRPLSSYFSISTCIFLPVASCRKPWVWWCLLKFLHIHWACVMSSIIPMKPFIHESIVMRVRPHSRKHSWRCAVCQDLTFSEVSPPYSIQVDAHLLHRLCHCPTFCRQIDAPCVSLSLEEDGDPQPYLWVSVVGLHPGLECHNAVA